MISFASSIAHSTGIIATVLCPNSFNAQCADTLTHLCNEHTVVAWCDLHTIEEPRDDYWRITLNDSTLNN
jgi:hypothetical protein